MEFPLHLIPFIVGVRSMKPFNKKIVFAAACAGMLLFGIVFLSLGTVLTFIREQYGLNQLAAGTLTTLLPLGVLAGSVIFGPVVDRYGYKYVLVFSAAVIFLALEGIALAGSLFILQLSFFCIGLGGGIINGATNALVADISTDSKGANLSLLGVFYGIGAVGMPLLLGVLIRYFTYRSIVGSIGFFVLLPLIFFLLTVFPSPKQDHGISIKSVAKLFSVVLGLFGMVLFFESALEGITNNWITSFAQERILLNTGAALIALTLLNVSLVCSRLLLGILLKRFIPYKILYAGLCLILTGAIILNFSQNMAGLLVGMIFIGLGFGPGFPVVLGYVGDLFPTLTGTAFSIVITMALVGNTLVNGLVGIVSQRYGIQYFPLVIIICIILMMIIFGLAINQFRKMKSH